MYFEMELLCFFVAGGVPLPSMILIRFFSFCGLPSRSENLRRSAFYTVNTMVSVHSVFSENLVVLQCVFVLFPLKKKHSFGYLFLVSFRGSLLGWILARSGIINHVFGHLSAGFPYQKSSLEAYTENRHCRSVLVPRM